MPDYSPSFDNVLHALANPTRRAVLQRLRGGTATVTELFEPFDMALQSFSQHLGVLEACGLVKTHKVGRSRTCELTPEPLRAVSDWLENYRRFWEARYGQLDALLDEMKNHEKEK